ncbi:Phosphomannomutase [uncultured virus]|nr:Phosphomannomutase [uncultured virus]
MVIVLFDVDGTLAPSGKQIEAAMVETLGRLAIVPDLVMGIVGGGSYTKIEWQLGEAIMLFTHIFAECGAVVYVDGIKVSERCMLDHCDRSRLNLILKKALSEISCMPIILHGQQLDFRSGLIYISPPGMQATAYEREIFLEQDRIHNLRQKLIDGMYECSKSHKGVQARCVGGVCESEFEIMQGGAVGIAVYPKGWDKSHSLEYFADLPASVPIYYFGDKTEPTGNDYPLYSHPRVRGVAVNSPTDTAAQICKLFLSDM